MYVDRRQQKKKEDIEMSCKKCEDEPLRTYIRIGNGNVEIRGCEEHLKRLIRLVRLGMEYEGEEEE